MSAQNSSSNENGLNNKQDVEPSSPPELLKKKRQNRTIYIAAFIVFQTGIIALFSLTIMKIRTPGFTVESPVFETFNIGTASNPSFDLKMNAQLGIKNTNFGGFKYEDTTVNFLYNGAFVGSGSVSSSQVGWRTTKMVNVLVDLSSNGIPANSQLGTDFNNSLLTLNSQAIMKGKVELFEFLFESERTVNLDCYIFIAISEKTVYQISCH